MSPWWAVSPWYWLAQRWGAVLHVMVAASIAAAVRAVYLMHLVRFVHILPLAVVHLRERAFRPQARFIATQRNTNWGVQVLLFQLLLVMLLLQLLMRRSRERRLANLRCELLLGK
jgi:hypothetical protein